MKKLHSLAARTWVKIVRMLIACLEADLRGRALDWLYPFLEEAQGSDGRYGRPGGRYHREPRP